MPHHSGELRRGNAKLCLFHRHCERSEAIQNLARGASLDCFVASLLAMTKYHTIRGASTAISSPTSISPPAITSA
jgi:hypothetical protein